MKKILFFIFIFVASYFSLPAYSSLSLPVDEVFSDISKNYPYYRELQTLYDRGMIVPDASGKFNPKQLLTRDDFVGILVEVSCKKCVQPNVADELFAKYKDTDLFFDINKENKNYYCIAEAKDQSYIQGYESGSVCNDGTSQDGLVPFCPNNTIVLEEALAIVMRASGIMSIAEQNRQLDQIASGGISPNLSLDVAVRNLDGNINSLYPYLEKALDYEIRDYDAFGTQFTYRLLEKQGDYLYPKKSINKEEFLKIAFVALKSNSCYEKQEDSLAVLINIRDKVCSELDIICKLSETGGRENTFDFQSILQNPDTEKKNQYIWKFYNKETTKTFSTYSQYGDNILLDQGGYWDVFLRVITPEGQTGTAQSQIKVYDDTNNNNQDVSTFLAYISATPLQGPGPLLSNFRANSTGGMGPYTYEWDFGDGTSQFGNNLDHIFIQEGVYRVSVIITDVNGQTIEASVSIRVTASICSGDADRDTLDDCRDLCPSIAGEISNQGCPIFETTCKINTDCKNGFLCGLRGVCEVKSYQTSCHYSGGSIISGNAVCNKCPCNYNFDFTASVRKCDIIFPAITSPDNSQIYSRGSYYEIR